MKAADPGVWQAQVAEITATDDGRVFHQLLEEWADHAETILDDRASPADALRATLPHIEQGIELPALYLAQLLAVLVMYWLHGGEDLFDGLTIFERRMVQTAVRMKIDELSKQAQQEETSGERE